MSDPKTGASKERTRTKRVGLSPIEDSRFHQVRHDLTADLGVSLHSSELLRAAIKVLIHSQDEIRRAARRTPLDDRPANSDAKARAKFDLHLARLFLEGIRKAPDMS